MTRVCANRKLLALSLNIALAAAVPFSAQAQQLVVTDGSTQVANGIYDTGTMPNGYALATANKGSMISGTGISVQTGGVSAHAVLADLYGRIQLDNSTVKTKGTTAYGVLAQRSGAIDISNTAISAGGTDAAGAVAMSGGQVTLAGGSISVSSGTGLSADGAGSFLAASGIAITLDRAQGANYGVNAQNGGVVSLGQGTSVSANGLDVGSGHALRSAGIGSHIHVDGATIKALNHAYGAVVSDGGSIELLDGTNVSATGGFGLASTGAGSVIKGSNLTVTSSGSAVLAALDNSEINLTGSVLSSGSSDTGVYASAGRINLKDFDLASQGHLAVAANNGATINLSRGVVRDIVYDSTGLQASGAASLINGDSVSVNVAGETSAGRGVVAINGGRVALGNGSSVVLNSNSSLDVTLLSSGAGSVIDMQNATATSGHETNLVGPWGAVAEDGGHINFGSASSLKVNGASTALYANGSGSVITSEGSSFQTTMGLDVGRLPGSLVMANGGRIDLNKGTTLTEVSTDVNDYVVNVSGEGSHFGATGATLVIDGDGVKRGGVWVHDHADATLADGAQLSVNTVGLRVDAGSTLAMQNSSIKAAQIDSAVITSGRPFGPTGALVYGSLVMNDSTIDAGAYGSAIQFGAPGDAVATDTALATVSGGRLSSQGAAAITSYRSPLNSDSAAVLTLRDGVRLAGKDEELVHVANWSNRTSALKVVADHVTMDGNLRADWGNIYPGFNSILDINLINASSLSGIVENARDVSLDGTSAWTLTGSSNVRRSLQNAGTISFSAPDDGGYKTLTVQGDYVGANGTIELNTRLNEGGALGNQFTDRMLVQGKVDGTTYLAVVGTGEGAATANKNNGAVDANDGISLVQVGGQSNASAFALKSGYVAVGPWSYTLTAYQPGSSSANQRVVAGSGDGFWDYRLQSVSVPNPDSSPDPTRDPIPDPTSNPDPAPNPDPSESASTPVRPGVVPQVPSYLSASTAMLSYGMRSLGTLHDRLGELHQGEVLQAGNTDEFYARTFGGNYQYRTDRSFSQYGYDFNQNDRGIQIGGTWLKTGSEASSFRLGMYASTGTSHVTPKAIDGTSAMRMSGSSLAATGTFMTGNSFYVDGVVARNYYSTRVDTAYRGYDMANMKTHGWTYSLESGYPFVFGSDVRLEPQAQVVYQSLRTNSFHDADGLTVTPENTGAWQGRVGANLGKTFVTAGGQHWTPWMRVNYLWGSSTRSTVDVASDEWGVSSTLATGSWGQAWQVGAGVTGALTPTLSVYGSGDYQGNVGSAGEQGWSANLGMRWQF